MEVSTTKKLLLKGGKVVNADHSISADVYCEDGKVVSIGAGLDIQGEGVTVVDVSGKILVPGGVDPHTHFHLPFVCKIEDDFSHRRWGPQLWTILKEALVLLLLVEQPQLVLVSASPTYPTQLILLFLHQENLY
jgi:imidazolonepropionase-like amidohydrolase